MTRFYLVIVFWTACVGMLWRCAMKAKPMPNDSQSRALTGKE